MSKLTVEEKIVKHYQSEDGVWLMEKGKIPEARLLKEAYQRIKQLKKDRDLYADLYSTASRNTSQRIEEQKEKFIAKRVNNIEEAITALKEVDNARSKARIAIMKLK